MEEAAERLEREAGDQLRRGGLAGLEGGVIASIACSIRPPAPSRLYTLAAPCPPFSYPLIAAPLHFPSAPCLLLTPLSPSPPPKVPNPATWKDSEFQAGDDLYRLVKNDKSVVDSFFWASHTFSHQVGEECGHIEMMGAGG